MDNFSLPDAERETARALLSVLESDTPANEQPFPTPGPAAPGATPFVVPDGYTIRETERTNPDGSKEVVREVVPLAPAAGTTPHHPAAPAPEPTAAAFTERRTLPQWLTDNRRRLKAGTYLAGATAVTTVGAVYGHDITAAVSAGADAVWSATVTVLKVVGVVVAVGLFARIAFGGGRNRRPRTGTFEGTIKGTWRQD
ncbi:hypothetical protein [Streptomyces sp. NPDC127100]|uniref:hypothetical protein n=1 Tax=Streptomyces sp. NPDC127100 TaxID=3347138 RepID=UPI00365F9111